MTTTERESPVVDLADDEWFNLPILYGFFVYALYGEDDDEVPLYIGQTTMPLTRAGAHLTGRRGQINRVAVRRCSPKEGMDETELRLIATHCPPWNRAGVPASAEGRTGMPPSAGAGSRRAAQAAKKAKEEAKLAGTAQVRADLRAERRWHTPEEIAERLGCTVGDVKDHVTEGRLRGGGGPRSPRFHSDYVIQMLEGIPASKQEITSTRRLT